MQGINSNSCRHWFKKLEILNTLILYIYSLMLLVVDKLHYFKLTPLFMRLIQCITINYTYLQLHFLLYTGTAYCAVRIFNKLPTGIAGQKNDKIVFQSALRKYLLTYVFYSKEEFLTNDSVHYILSFNTLVTTIVVSTAMSLVRSASWREDSGYILVSTRKGHYLKN
jgi:hypothetical protein